MFVIVHNYIETKIGWSINHLRNNRGIQVMDPAVTSREQECGYWMNDCYLNDIYTKSPHQSKY